MTFLQPWLLVGLPLVAVPIIIHLINQRRFQSIHWGAMMFLLAAQRMARGYSRLRQWLIMLFRMLAVAGLVLAVSRPLASGWLGVAAGGKPDTTIVLLDRSPSMQQRATGGDRSKLESGRQQLARTLETLGSNRWVLIESARHEPRELASPAALLDVPNAGPAGAAADLPRMLEAARDYIRDQRAGRTDIWICSDLRGNDWTADSGRWATLRDAFLEFPQSVRFQLLAYPQAAQSNVSVRVTSVRRQATSDGAELLVSVRLSRSGDGAGKLELPLNFELEGARSSVTVELTGEQMEVRDHHIPLDTSRQRGWGRVSIPADVNPADDEFYFVFDQPPLQRTLVVTDDPEVERTLMLAAAIAPDESTKNAAEAISADALSAVEWEEVSLVLWQAALPSSPAAKTLEAFVARGGQVVFFPPPDPSGGELFGVQWRSWSDTGATTVENWRGDADLLARTLSGAALPVGQLEIHRYCGLAGECTPLARLRAKDGEAAPPLLVRVPTDRGGVYFWTTTPATRDSSLATGGVVLYAFVQRALAAGSSVLGKTRQMDAGDAGQALPSAGGQAADSWQRLAGPVESLSLEAGYHSGVFSAGDRLLALNRPAAEDDSKVLADARVAELFDGLQFARVDDQAGGASSLIQEIWRMFLLAMLVALVLEAVLCLPKVTNVRIPGFNARATSVS